MKSVRTPDERFENLPGYSFLPNYIDIDDQDEAAGGGKLRMHYVDEGPKGGPLVLCLHGQPSWSYLYRKMIPLFVEGGCRVIAPDLVGFGRSDKPTKRSDYSYARHVAWLTDFVCRLDLRDITLFCQDWGGLIGLRVAAENPERFARIVTANTALPDADQIPADQIASVAEAMRKHYASIPVPASAPEMGKAMASDPSGFGFHHWVKFCDQSPAFRPGDLLGLITGGMLSPEEVDAYQAPFPEEAYMAGAREFPSLVPLNPENPAIPANRAAWEVFRKWDKPFLTTFSDGDPITAGRHLRFQKQVPGAKGQAHETIKGAGHFLQEQAAEPLVAATLRFIEANPSSPT